MMKAVLDGEIILSLEEKKKLLPARDSIREIVYNEAKLSDVYDKTLESAIKLIVKFTKKRFPSLVFNNPRKSQDRVENMTDQESDSETSEDDQSGDEQESEADV